MKNIKWLILALFSIGFLSLIIFFQPLKDITFKWLLKAEISEMATHNGTKVERQVIVTTYDTQHSFQLDELLPDEHFLLVFDSWCEPCQQAMRAYLTLSDSDSAPLYLLSFNKNDTPPVGFPLNRFLISESRRSDTVFAGRSYPVLWFFSEGGLVVDIIIGYDESKFNNLLQLNKQISLIRTKQPQ